MTTDEVRTPREDGFAMPAEWEPHEATLIAWPTRTRNDLWGELFEDAEREYSTVANAIADFEPVVMVVDPSQVDEARKLLSSSVELLAVPIDDSWIRDSGAREQVAAALPGREIIQVPARTLHEGGGGPHCITQQVPAA